MSLTTPADRRQSTGSLVAVIDSVEDRRQAMVSLLKPYYRLVEFGDGDQAIAGLMKEPPAAALVSERVAPLGGYDTVRRLRESVGLEGLPVILIVADRGKTAQNGLQWSGANRLLVWPCTPSALLTMVSSLCGLHVQRRWEALSPAPRQALQQTLAVFNGLTETIQKGGIIDIDRVGEACASLVEALSDNHLQTILDGVKDHDDYTYVHCLRVSSFLAMFGHITGLTADEQVILATGGLLHDVGKIRIARDILNKPDRLSPDEFAVIKTHVPSTVHILHRVPNIRRPIITIAEQHHEKLDGSGYPQGLTGSQLDELARMAAIVDIFGALTDRRTYKPPMEPQAALNLMLDEMSSHLDMRFLAMFRQAMLDAATFSNERPDQSQL